MFKFTPHAIKSAVVATTLALSAFSLNAQAALTSYTNAGKDLVYSSVSDVTWTKDANLLGTLIGSQGSTVVNAIIAAGAANGITVTAANFSSNDAKANWLGAFAYVSYLNSINYGGSNQWRLPTLTAPTRAGGPTSGNGITAGDEFVELHYEELSGLRRKDMPNPGIFTNFDVNNSYWTGTELDRNNAWAYAKGTSSTNSNISIKSVWAVTSGDLRPAAPSAVPVPAAAWLFGSGLVGLVGLRRRKQVV